MKKILVFGIIYLIAFTAFAVDSRYIGSQGFQNIKGNAGVRAMGMGGAFTAVANDSSSMFWNPAGLSKVKRPEINGQFVVVTPLDKEGAVQGDVLGQSATTFTWGAVASKIDDIAFGFSYNNLLNVNSNWTRPKNGLVYSGFGSSTIYHIGNAQPFDKWVETYDQSISVYSVGLAKKFAAVNLGIVANVWNGTHKTNWDVNTGNTSIFDANNDRTLSGYTIDLGMLIPNGPLTIGAVWKGFVTSLEQKGSYSESWYSGGAGAESTSSNLGTQYWHDGAAEKITIGLAFEPGILTLAADIDYANNQFGDYRLGTEIDFSLVKARAGISSRKVIYDNYKSGARTTETLNDYSLGAGLSLLGYIDVDAAIVFEGYKTVEEATTSLKDATNVTYIVSGTVRL